jgi:hypothetical protein
MSGSGPIYEYQRELTAKLEQTLRERDEARAEVKRLRKAKHTSDCLKQSAYNAECVCGADEAQRDLLRTVAERQREACARAFKWPSEALAYYQAAEVVRATPLVTDANP